MRRFLQFFFFSIILLFIILSAFLPKFLPPQTIKDFLTQFGYFAPAIFIAIYATRGIFLFLPAGLLSITAGMFFGIFPGSLYIIIGASFSALLTYLLAGKLGHNSFLIEGKSSSGKIQYWQQKLQNHGFWTIFILRLIPIFHFDLISIGAGLTGIPVRRFVWGTILGIIPFTILNASLGNAIIFASQSTIIIILSIIIILTFLPVMFPQLHKSIEKFI